LSKLTRLVSKLKKRSYPKEQFFGLLQNLFGMFENPETIYQTLIARGLPLGEHNGKIFLKTARTPYRKQVFTVVDIETSGSKPDRAQVIEIGAIKFCGDEVIDRFESFIYAEEVPEYITKLTGIEASDLESAPSQAEVLRRFKEFLGDSVFVAHNVNFDYNFISHKLMECGLGELANRRLCSIDLARRTIESERYGLEYLNENLGIRTAVSHRAYADALTAYEVMRRALAHVPKEIKTTEELIDFSKKGKKLSAKKRLDETRPQEVAPVVDGGAKHIQEPIHCDDQGDGASG